MKIGIIGAGSVGGTLGRRWASLGHSVTFGFRDPGAQKSQSAVKAAGPGTRGSTVAEAIAAAETVALCVPWDSAQAVLQAAGNFRGKVLLDCTNPLRMGARGLELALDSGESGGERVASWARGARVVKVFNTTGFGNMANPRYGGDCATMFYCGDDAPAKTVAAKLGSELGFDMVDAGDLAKARLLEPLAMLWIHLAMGQKLGLDIAFRLLRR